MIVLLLVYAITQSGFGGAIPAPSLDARGVSSGGASIQTRTIWDIVWSCLSTIFLCTWSSLHPNISYIPQEPGESRLRKRLWNLFIGFLKYKLPLFLWALLVPEYILAWAIRQYLMANRIQKKVPGWTRTHGFFLIMGGFQLFERPDQALRSMDGETSDTSLIANPPGPGKFVRIIDTDDVEQHRLENVIPFTSEAELKDRGKSDGIAKSIVLLQTSWFIIQCIARGVEHLPLTELEIVTLAYTMMNVSIYIFWWNKPRDVGCPIRVYESLTTRHSPKLELPPGFLGTIVMIGGYIFGGQDVFFLLSEERQVPMFWSGVLKGQGDEVDAVPVYATLGPLILGMGFGAIHMIAWSYVFPSSVELELWRISCIAMVAIPFLATVFCGFLMAQAESMLLKVIALLVGVTLLLSAWLYFAARIATIVVAFTTLRSLPSDALTAVDWTAFIPHL